MMKLCNFSFALVVVLCVCPYISAQSIAPSNWVRLQTDNGEFSVDVPNDFSYFFNKDGFSVSEHGDDHLLSEVSLLNAYQDETLVTFEVYRGSPRAFRTLIDVTKVRNSREGSTKLNGFQVKEVRAVDKGFFVIYYFRSNEFIYVVSVLSRTIETPVMKRFIESIKFIPSSKQPASDAIKLSSLPTVRINLKTRDGSPYVPKKPPDKPPDRGPNDKVLLIASIPRPSYVGKARNRDVQGTVQFRIEFPVNGFITNIEILKSLPEGLARQALFAALRTKYLPEIKNGSEVPATRIVEYSFSIF